MKKLLAVVALVAPMIALLPATSAVATDNVCAPITADGQPIFCADVQPVDDLLAQLNPTVAQVEALAALVLSDAERLPVDEENGLEHCDVTTSHGNETDVYLSTGGTQDPVGYGCSGVKVSVTQPSSSSVPVHVPQLCLTTTGTCVGPVDAAVPVPNTSGLEVCAVYETYEVYPDTGPQDVFVIGDITPVCATSP